MSALALILAKRGCSVSGSDQRKSHTIQKLLNQGITVFASQQASNIHAICKNKNLSPLVVVSTAIPQNNPELQAAKAARLKILHRSDLLAELIQDQDSIVVSGTHGKTTTSTIITTLLSHSGMDPTAVIGGRVPFLDSNGHAGQSKLLVAEADESDGSLIRFKPSIGLITNLELDHTDHYSDLNHLIKTMKAFGKGCQQLLGNYDCPNLRANFKPSAWWSTQTYKEVEFAALPTSINGKETIANIYEKNLLLGQIKLPLPGIHNLNNTIAAIAACRVQGIPFHRLQKAIETLQAPSRRFDFQGDWNGRQIVDDYAHHPSEVNATIEMARLMIKTKQSPLPKVPKRLVAIFQPHRYSRLKKFVHEFAVTLGKADFVLLAPVYGAGEMHDQTINSNVLAKRIKKLYPKLNVLAAKSIDELILLIQQNTFKDDLILTMGAGDINNIWTRLQDQPNSNQWLSTQQAA